MSTDTGGGPKPGSLFTNEWLAPGLLFIAFGALGLWVSRDYDMGNVNQMGSGWFPRALCIGLVALGTLIAWRGLFDRTPVEDKGSATRGFVVVILSMAFFALTIEGFNLPMLGFKISSLGFIGSLGATLLISSLAQRGQKPLEVLFTTTLIVVLSVATFIYALKLPFRLWPEL